MGIDEHTIGSSRATGLAPDTPAYAVTGGVGGRRRVGDRGQ